MDPHIILAVTVSAAIGDPRGGMLIHGAISARKYGIPFMTGNPQATEFMESGNPMTVDGYYGLVIIHSQEHMIEHA